MIWRGWPFGKRAAFPDWHPITFSDEAVRAIEAGRKTQCRRPIKPPPVNRPGGLRGALDTCPFGQSGDCLWVRQVWCPYRTEHVFGDCLYAYRSECWPPYVEREFREKMGYEWQPARSMPREAARLNLKITWIAVQPLHEITDDDLLADFVQTASQLPRDAYAADWNRRYGHRKSYSWQRNPWVYAIGFTQMTPES